MDVWWYQLGSNHVWAEKHNGTNKWWKKKITWAEYAKWNEAGAICDVQSSPTQIAFNARVRCFRCQRGLLRGDSGPSSGKRRNCSLSLWNWRETLSFWLRPICSVSISTCNKAVRLLVTSLAFSRSSVGPFRANQRKRSPPSSSANQHPPLRDRSRLTHNALGFSRNAARVWLSAAGRCFKELLT